MYDTEEGCSDSRVRPFLLERMCLWMDGWMDSCQLGIVPFVGYESTESCLYIYPSLLFSKKKIKK